MHPLTQIIVVIILSFTALTAWAQRSTSVEVYNRAEGFTLKHIEYSGDTPTNPPAVGHTITFGNQQMLTWQSAADLKPLGVATYHVYSTDQNMHYGTLTVVAANPSGGASSTNCAAVTFVSNFTDLITAPVGWDQNFGQLCRDRLPTDEGKQIENLGIRTEGNTTSSRVYFYGTGDTRNDWVGEICIRQQPIPVNSPGAYVSHSRRLAGGPAEAECALP